MLQRRKFVISKHGWGGNLDGKLAKASKRHSEILKVDVHEFMRRKSDRKKCSQTNVKFLARAMVRPDATMSYKRSHALEWNSQSD